MVEICEMQNSEIFQDKIDNSKQSQLNVFVEST
jgi:hypothetical protein